MRSFFKLKKNESIIPFQNISWTYVQLIELSALGPLQKVILLDVMMHLVSGIKLWVFNVLQTWWKKSSFAMEKVSLMHRHLNDTVVTESGRLPTWHLEHWLPRQMSYHFLVESVLGKYLYSLSLCLVVYKTTDWRKLLLWEFKNIL